MGYDLRHLKRKALIRQVSGKLCYTLTPYGRRMALFLTKLQARVLRPGLQVLDLSIVSRASPPLRDAFNSLDSDIVDLVKQANLAA